MPIRFSSLQPRSPTNTPSLGEHNEEVLTAILGRTDAMVRDLMGGHPA